MALIAPPRGNSVPHCGVPAPDARDRARVVVRVEQRVEVRIEQRVAQQLVNLRQTRARLLNRARDLRGS